MGQTTIILDADILDNLNTDSFSGLIPSERIKGLGSLLGTGSTTVSLSTSFVELPGDPINIGIAWEFR